MKENPRITIAEILAAQGEVLKMSLVAGEKGLHRYIDHPRLQKPSLAFAGFIKHLSDIRMQMIGQTEIEYLETRTEAEQKYVIDAVFDLRLACVVITRGITPPPLILAAAQRTDTPLIISEYESESFMANMTLFLSHALAPVTHHHGVYMDVFGMGVLLRGDSGIGKSEIGLELISRGHRLIADDMVELVRETPTVLVGRSPEVLRYQMEVRGLGILDIRNIFGAAGITDTKRVRLVVDLIPWEDYQEKNRLNSDEEVVVHGVKLPLVQLFVRPGRSLAALIEVATRNQLLKQRGFNSTETFTQALRQRIQEQSN